tara:strand:- start:83 stop:271 length:189 start_codon:yes stop_codon:yes gene_type:complete
MLPAVLASKHYFLAVAAAHVAAPHVTFKAEAEATRAIIANFICLVFLFLIITSRSTLKYQKV